MPSVSKKQQPTVVIYRPADATGSSHRQLEALGCRVVVVADGDGLLGSMRAFHPVHAVLAASLHGEYLDAASLREQQELRIVAKYTIGVDDIDLEAASDLGILVTHSPAEANWGGVAEGTIALMLALLKKVGARDRQVRAGRWRDEALRGTYLGSRADGYAGITVGIVGLGRIGRRVADLLAPWNLRLLATDPYVDAAEFESRGVQAVPLDILLRESDVVSLHCQLTAETEWMIDAQRLSLMKATAVLVNTARGRIVDVDALAAALRAGRLGGAALDVLPQEPPPRDARILDTDERVILSPHMTAANQGGTLAAAVPLATSAVLSALAGDIPEHVYNETAIERWRARFAGRSMLSA